MDKPLEMAGEKVNVILRMQHPGSGQITFAQGAPDAAAVLMQELRPAWALFPWLSHTSTHRHSFMYIILIKRL